MPLAGEILAFVWEDIIPDDWKAHGKRDYLYHNVAEALLWGDPAYLAAKTAMLQANVPAWKAFPDPSTTGNMGVTEIVAHTYWSLLVAWNSLYPTFRRPMNQLDGGLAPGRTFDNVWRDALKKTSYFNPVMWSERIDPGESDERGFGFGRDGENFSLSWHWHTDDPDEEEITYFAEKLAAFINGYRVSSLRKATQTVVSWMVYLKEQDDQEFLPVTLLDERFWQKNWRRCNKCQGLFYAGHNNGVCPNSRDGHDGSDSKNYSLHYNEPDAEGQHEWRYCKKCQGLYYAGGRPKVHVGDVHVCPAGGVHDGSRSGDYIMHKSIDAWNAERQSNWHRCKKCEGLYSTGAPNQVQVRLRRTCPTGEFHDRSSSGEYVLRMVSDEEPPIVK
jgi:hypothetical protein